MSPAGRSTGRRKAATTAGSAPFDAPTSNFVRAKMPHIDPTPRYFFENLPEPIDLDLDLTRRMIYWTDRGANIVSRAAMDPPPGTYLHARTDQQVLMSGLKEAIGITLTGDRMDVTDLGGTVYTARLDGSDKRVVLEGQGSLTGITFLPAVTHH